MRQRVGKTWQDWTVPGNKKGILDWLEKGKRSKREGRGQEGGLKDYINSNKNQVGRDTILTTYMKIISMEGDQEGIDDWDKIEGWISSGIIRVCGIDLGRIAEAFKRRGITLDSGDTRASGLVRP